MSEDVRALARHEDCVAASKLMAQVWGTSLDGSPFQPDLLVSLRDSGACVLGIFDADELLGVTVAVAGAPGSKSLYSLIAGVSRNAAGRGIGTKLKLAQRDWALEHGAEQMVWTYDPLIRRNAYFNLNRLGATIADYVAEFYPPMHDEVNRGDRPDRFHVVWHLRARARQFELHGGPVPYALRVGERNEPVPAGEELSDSVLVQIPADIEALRAAEPELGSQWREVSGELFARLFDAGLRPVRITEEGAYLFQKES